jgi:hypothetical protein
MMRKRGDCLTIESPEVDAPGVTRILVHALTRSAGAARRRREIFIV